MVAVNFSSSWPTHVHTESIYRMTLSSCNLVLAVLLLLIISVTAVTVSQPWQCDSENCRRYELRELFEEALVSSSDALWQLQQIYFDPSSDQSPALVNCTCHDDINNIIIICMEGFHLYIIITLNSATLAT